MRYADIKYFDVINGPGVRVSVFVSGCSHFCEHCFNYKTWDPDYGSDFNNETMLKIFDYIEMFDSTIRGISLLGGDPTYKSNIKPLSGFLREFKRRFPNKDIWIWSGYTWEQILSMSDVFDLVSMCDVLVDGKFDNNLKDLSLKFKGSSNQRVIDIKNSIEMGRIVER